MIGDLMGRMADAEKLSVDQLKTALQNGTLPPYIGIPLLQDKVKQTQMMQTAQAGQQPQQPPIAEQVMAQANQVAGVDQLPSNLPTGQEPAYAAGGIVAFAEGDLVDDDEVETEDDRQEASLMALMAAAQNKIKAGLGRATSSFTSALPKSVQNILPSQKTEAPTTASTTSTVPTQGGLSGLLSSAATKYGVPADLLGRISGAESSGKATAANPRSSAKGIFQFTDSTWRGMGGKPGEQFNPEANVDLGAKYIRQNAEHLKKTLGRDPNFHEVYAAHMFGPGVSKMLNKANPKDPIERGLSMFQSSDMVKKVMRANPNLRGKSVGEVLDGLQSKTGQGIVALAHGGKVQHFQTGGSTMGGFDDAYTDVGVPLIPEIEEYVIDPMTGEKLFSGYRNKKGSSSKASVPTAQELKDFDQAAALFEAEQRAKQPPVAPVSALLPDEPQARPQTIVEEATDPYLEKYMSMLQKREAASEKQKDIDVYMSLMQAGLGMMGGSSPYALQNIGAGGSQGLSAYAAAQKQRAAEEAATLSGYGKLYTAKQAADLRRELAEQNKDTALTKLKQDKQIQLGRQIDFLEKSFDTIAEKNVKTALGNGFTDLDQDQKLKAIAQEAQRLRSKSTRLKDLYKELGVPEPDAAAPEYKNLSADEYYKMFGLKPKPKQ
jgi:soluble lytic murein transglycosylase-like protein